MPKEAIHVLAAQKQRVKIKERVHHYVAAKVYLQVLGSGAEGAPKSIYMFTDHGRYMFNCGEGTQRIAHEHKMKLSKLEHIFITQAIWRNIGGLPGTALTIQDVGVPRITLHGPTGLLELFEATRKFVIMRNMEVQMADCTEENEFEDSVMRVKYVPLTARKEDNQLSSNSHEREQQSMDLSLSSESNVPSTDFNISGNLYSHQTGESCSDSFVLTDKMKSVLVKQKRLATVMAFVCQLQPRPGCLNLSKCVQLGVPPGPKLGDLKNRRSVTLDNGVIITPEQVCEPDEPGPIFIIVDCPTVEYIDSLIANPTILKHTALAAKPDDLAYIVVHFTPSYIADMPQYLAWIDKFSPSTRHLFINDRNTCMGSIAVHRIQQKLNMINNEFFPLLGDAGTLPKNAASPSALSNNNFIQPGSCYNFDLRPKVGQQGASEIRLDPDAYFEETQALNGFNDELETVRVSIKQMKDKMTIREYPKLLFLGTGSCIPNKTRNTSGILVSSTPTNHILMDCGEGTYGQIIRFFGEPKARYVLANINVVYISHLHADHHLGLIGFLQGRRRARQILGLPEKPVYLLAPKQIWDWLQFYHSCFEDIEEEYKLIGNCSLLMHQETTNDAEKYSLMNAANLQDVRTCLVKHCPNAFGVRFELKDNCTLVYSGDTLPSENLVKLGENCDVLIHEATMEDDLLTEAKIKLHSTTSQAIHIGQRMNAKHILLTHFSQRYAKLPRFNENFTDNVGIAFDNMTISVDALPLFPLVYNSLRVLFAEDCDDMQYKAFKRAKRLKVLENE